MIDIIPLFSFPLKSRFHQRTSALSTNGGGGGGVSSFLSLIPFYDIVPIFTFTFVLFLSRSFFWPLVFAFQALFFSGTGFRVLILYFLRLGFCVGMGFIYM
jgi:hypothetical protein